MHRETPITKQCGAEGMFTPATLSVEAYMESLTLGMRTPAPDSAGGSRKRLLSMSNTPERGRWVGDFGCCLAPLGHALDMCACCGQVCLCARCLMFAIGFSRCRGSTRSIPLVGPRPKIYYTSQIWLFMFFFCSPLSLLGTQADISMPAHTAFRVMIVHLFYFARKLRHRNFGRNFAALHMKLRVQRLSSHTKFSIEFSDYSRINSPRLEFSIQF